MTSINPTVIRVSNPAELLALVPYLIGFQPASSLVVLALASGKIVVTARMDLPDGPTMEPSLRVALDTLTATMAADGATDALLVGYGPAEPVSLAVQAATAAFHTVAVPVREALRVAEDRFYSLTCPNPGCCPPDGTPFDPSVSVAAASATAAGLVALPSRDALAASLDPVTGAARTAMEEATIAAAEALLARYEAAAPVGGEPDTSPNTPLGRDLLRTGRRLLDQAQRQYRAGRQPGDHDTALLTLLLELPSVRDVAARATTSAPWHITMWTDLTRRAQPDLSAAPATLLALAALLAGRGALADIAVQRALHVDPADPLAWLLAQAVAAGIDPATAEALLAG